MDTLRSDTCHEQLINNYEPELAYNDNVDFDEWKQALSAKFLQVLGDLPAERTPLNIKIISRQQKESHTEIELHFDSEPTYTVPAHLWIPNSATADKPVPVIICLQGHSTGMHISLGQQKYPNDERSLATSAHAVNAVANGYAALVIEQRGMGVKKSDRVYRHIDSQPPMPCDWASLTALLLGRTLIGERVWDISRAIDTLTELNLPEIDINKIVCLGNSGGGTATYYASAYDKRIALSVPSCAVSSYKDSIGNIVHCMCNYVPGTLKYFDMGEISALIAPRPLFIFNGKIDPIFPIEGVKQVYSVIEKIYARAGAADKCELHITPKAHYFSYDLIWPRLNRHFNK